MHWSFLKKQEHKYFRNFFYRFFCRFAHFIHFIVWKNCSLKIEDLYHEFSTDEVDYFTIICPEVFIDISQNSQENTCVNVSFLTEL